MMSALTRKLVHCTILLALVLILVSATLSVGCASVTHTHGKSQTYPYYAMPQQDEATPVQTIEIEPLDPIREPTLPTLFILN